MANTLRKWNRNIHRDLGYLCFALTVIYAISGVAVNHVDSWNPNYKISKIEKQLPPFQMKNGFNESIIHEVLSELNMPPVYKSYFKSSPETVQIFVDRHTIFVNLSTGHVLFEKIETRFALFELNFLHLNHAKKWWTIFADAYAISLLLLAISGLFILKGKNGITGRGAWLTLIGIIIPALALFLYRT